MSSSLVRFLPLLAAPGALFLFAHCSEPEPLPTKLVGVKDHIFVDTLEAMRNSEQRIAIEQREALTQVVGSTLELPLAAEGRAHIWTAATLLLPDGWSGDKTSPVEFELVWKCGERSERVVKRSTIEEATGCWAPIELDRDEPLTERSVLALTARGLSELPPGLRVAWAVPEVEGYFQAPLARPLTPEQRARPNVLFVSFDTLRADHVSAYGYSRETTPNVDAALAAKGVLFERAISNAPWTMPAYGSVFTGLHPGRHAAGMIPERQKKYGTEETCESEPSQAERRPLRDGVPTLAQLLADAGWRTAEFSNNHCLNPTFGLDRGFQRLVSYRYNALAGVELARAWIERQDRPWFCFLHVMDPHIPYAPPEPWDTKFRPDGLTGKKGWPPSPDQLKKIKGSPDAELRQALVDYYDSDIAFADHQLGRLMDELEARGTLANTIVVFHSDHGEEFWDHGGFAHGHSLHTEVLHIPLILRFDGRLPAGLRIPERVAAFDLFPTLLELAGLPVPPGIDAVSLLPSIRSETPRMPRDVTAEFLLFGEYEAKARYVGSEKLIAKRSSVDLVFDVAADPLELVDLAKERAAFIARERAVLGRMQIQTLQSIPPRVRVRLTEGEFRRLVAEGYAGPGDEEPDAGAAPR